RRAAWAGGVALGLAVLVALTILAVRSGPDRPAVAGAGTDEPDSLAVTLPVPPPDSLGGSDPPPLAVAAPEEPLPEEVPSDARAEEEPPEPEGPTSFTEPPEGVVPPVRQEEPPAPPEAPLTGR